MSADGVTKKHLLDVEEAVARVVAGVRPLGTEVLPLAAAR